MNFRFAVKILAFLLLFSAFTLFLGGVWLGIISRSLPDVRFLSDPDASFQITVRDWQGNERPFLVGPGNPSWTPLTIIPEHLRNAVLAGEDFSFYGHNGVDWFEVKETIHKNLKLGRFARGASTITQQLAKNLFLSREKTLKRKIRELILARSLEKALTKDRILELYLNIVELGEMIYGVDQGSHYHFGKEPIEITLRESTFLAAMLPGPKVYNPERRLDSVMNRSDHLLSVMLKGRMISEGEYLTALDEIPFAQNPQSSVDLFSELPIEEQEEMSVQGSVMGLPPVPFNGEIEPVPIPIPGYTEMEEDNAEDAAGSAAPAASTDTLSR